MWPVCDPDAGDVIATHAEDAGVATVRIYCLISGHSDVRRRLSARENSHIVLSEESLIQTLDLILAQNWAEARHTPEELSQR